MSHAVSPPAAAEQSSGLTRASLVAARRFITIGSLAFWQGGFTFYGAVVIHVAHRVLGSHLPVGFITQRVSNWLNVIGAATLLVLLLNLFIARREGGKRLWWSLAATWAVMVITLIVLIAMHPMLDRLLDAQAREIVDGEQFRPLHRMYLNVATVQWAAGLIHLWCLMMLTVARSPSGSGGEG